MSCNDKIRRQIQANDLVAQARERNSDPAISASHVQHAASRRKNLLEGSDGLLVPVIASPSSEPVHTQLRVEVPGVHVGKTLLNRRLL